MAANELPSINIRLKEYMDHKGVSKRELSQQIGMSEKTLGNKLNGSRKLDIDTLQEIASHNPDLSLQWLLTGTGDMIIEKPSASPAAFSRHVRVPLVGQYAQAGYLAGYSDVSYMESLPTIDFLPDREMTGYYVAFEVKGDSMNDGTTESYQEGEIVICREVEPYLYKDSKLHINQRDFIIVHEDGILIKRITEHNVENHTITIHSLNPLYNDRIIDLAQVKQIFSIVESRKQRRR
jgi:phage repressor protein C with HTH and peptisase S24 domain